MIHKLRDYDPEAPVIVLDIGNTATHIATWHDNKLKTPLVEATTDDDAIEAAIKAHVNALNRAAMAGAVIGSVVTDATERVSRIVDRTLECDALVIGIQVPLPMEVDVSDAKAVGVDRVCAAYAAHERIQMGCIVVDLGTAVTVDLVDDDGVFLGGAILPGIGMQLRSLHEHTSALPLVAPFVPELPYGRSTTEAIQNGVCRGIAGAVRELVEGYASHLRRWPQTVATGGDLALMKPLLPFVDTFVSDLTLRGIGLAYTKHLLEQGV